mgnify:CR=1 FL=1
MNEPMCDYEGEDKVNSKYHDVYSLLYNAVRRNDPEHIITLEAIWTPDDMPHPKEYGWENVMYQYHFYDDSNDSFKKVSLHHASKNFNVPVLVGEFSPCRGTATWEYILNLFNECSYNWLTWTYKGHCAKGKTSQWFMFGSDDEGNVVGQDTSAYDAAVSRFMLGSENPEENELQHYYTMPLEKSQELRYGENAHQKAALYLTADHKGAFGGMEQFQGKELLHLFRNFTTCRLLQ